MLGQVLKGRRLGLVEIDVAVKRLRVVEAYQLSQFRNEVNTLKVGAGCNPSFPACRAQLLPHLMVQQIASCRSAGPQKAGTMQCGGAGG